MFYLMLITSSLEKKLQDKMRIIFVLNDLESLNPLLHISQCSFKMFGLFCFARSSHDVSRYITIIWQILYFKATYSKRIQSWIGTRERCGVFCAVSFAWGSQRLQLRSLDSILYMWKACVDELQVKVRSSCFCCPLFPSSGGMRGCTSVYYSWLCKTLNTIFYYKTDAQLAFYFLHTFSFHNLFHVSSKCYVECM